MALRIGYLIGLNDLEEDCRKMLSKIKNAASQKLDTKSNKLQRPDTNKDAETENNTNNKNKQHNLLESIVSKLRRTKKNKERGNTITTTNEDNSKNIVKEESAIQSENQDITLRLSSIKLDGENSPGEKINCDDDSSIASPTNQTDEDKETTKTDGGQMKPEQEHHKESKDEDTKCDVSNKSVTSIKDNTSSGKHGDKEYFIVVKRNDVKKDVTAKKVEPHTKHKKEKFVTVQRRERRAKMQNGITNSESVSTETDVEENLKEIHERLANLNVKSIQKTKEIVLVDERKKEVDKHKTRIIELSRGPIRTAKSSARHHQESVKSKYSHININAMSGGGLLNEDDDPSVINLPATIPDNDSCKTNIQGEIPQVVQVPRNGLVQSDDAWDDLLDVLKKDLEVPKLAPKELQQPDWNGRMNNVNSDLNYIEQSVSFNLQQDEDINFLDSLIASGMQANARNFSNDEAFAKELFMNSNRIPTVRLNENNVDLYSGSESDSPPWLPNPSVASSNSVSPSDNFTYSNTNTGVSLDLSPLDDSIYGNSPICLQNSETSSTNNSTSIQMQNFENIFCQQPEGFNTEMSLSPPLYPDDTNVIRNILQNSSNYIRSDSDNSATTNNTQNTRDDLSPISQPNSIISSSSESNIYYSDTQGSTSMSPTSKKLTSIDSISTVLPSPSYSASNSSNSPFVSPQRYPNTTEMSPVSIGSPNLGAIGVDKRWNVTKHLFADIVKKLDTEEYVRVCYRVQSMKMSDVYRLITATLDALPKEKPEKASFALGIFYAACHRLLMTNPCAFHAADLVVEWLMAGAVQCCQWGIVIRCLLDCYRLSVAHCDGASCKHDAAFKERDTRGNSVVYRLVCQGDAYADALTEILLHSNASLDLSALNIDGYSALHLACKHHGEAAEDGATRSCLRSASLLIEQGHADVMQTDGKSGYTPLHLAVDSPNADPQLVALLLENCADKRVAVNFKNYGNQTPLELARARQKSGEGLRARRVFELLKKSR